MDNHGAMLICDFCLRPAVLVKDFHPPDGRMIGELGDVTWIDDGVWGACAECATRIEKKDFRPIIQAAIERTKKMYGIVPSETKIKVMLRYALGSQFDDA